MNLDLLIYLNQILNVYHFSVISDIKITLPALLDILYGSPPFNSETICDNKISNFEESLPKNSIAAFTLVIYP